MENINNIQVNKLYSLRMFMVLLCLLPCFLVQGKDKSRKCIMVFGSHADDVEQMAGGTFARYMADGYQGIYVCVMNNLSGNRIEKFPGNWDFEQDTLTAALTSSPKMYQVGALETMQIRKEEALRACKILGAEPVFLDFCEPEIWLGRKLIIYGTQEYITFNPPGRKHVSLGTRYSEDVDFVVELLRKYQPEITIIHTLGGEKLDHGESAHLMYLAFKKAISRDIKVGKLWMRARGWLLDNEAQTSGRGIPDVRIDMKHSVNILVKRVASMLTRPLEIVQNHKGHLKNSLRY